MDLETLEHQIVETAYNGNPLIKPAGTKIDLTMDQLEEYLKCEADPIYFIRNYVKIISLDEGIINFRMWDFQENMVRTCVENRFVIAKMPRQVGKTTTTAAIILWHVLFNSEYSVAILANKMDQAQEILERIQMAYENMPKWMQQGVVTWNKRRIVLENKSRIIAAATSSSSIRGKSINLIYLDEFAHIDRNLQQKFFTSTYPVISSGKKTKVIITSTPNGYELFAKMWMDAEEGRSSYIPLPVHWSDIPGRDEAWKMETISNTSQEQFDQEYECEFLGSSATLIESRTIAQISYHDPLKSNHNIKIFKDPVAGHKYFIAADVARGGEGVGDYSAFVVVDVTTFPYEVVAVFRDNRVTPVVYPNYIDHASRMYNEAYILVEVNDIGGQVADILNYDLENENLLMVGQSGKKGQMLGGGKANAKFGVRTTPAVKRIGCFAFKGLMENRQLMVNDFQIVQEISTFIAKGKSYEADVGNHDDLVMCLVLFSWASTQKYFTDLVESDVRLKILQENSSIIEDDMTPFGFGDSHDEDEHPAVINTLSDFESSLLY